MDKKPKKFFVASSMDYHPDSIKVGSIITNLGWPDNTLSSYRTVFAPPLEAGAEAAQVAEAPAGDVPAVAVADANAIQEGPRTIKSDNPLLVTPYNATGHINKSSGWGLGVFATFLKALIQALNISIAKKGSDEFWYKANEIHTHRFAPSKAYITSAMADPGVARFFEKRGTEGRAYIITAVRIASGLVVVRSSGGSLNVKGQAGIEIPDFGSVGPKVWYDDSGTEYAKEEYAGPVVFAFSVEQLRQTKDGEVVRQGVVTGDMHGLRNADEKLKFVVESQVDEDYISDSFNISKVEAVDEEGEVCEVFVKGTRDE